MLSNESLDLIKQIHNMATKIEDYTVAIELWKFDKTQETQLEIRISKFEDSGEKELECIRIFKEEVCLNSDNSIEKLKEAIEELQKYVKVENGDF